MKTFLAALTLAAGLGVGAMPGSAAPLGPNLSDRSLSDVELVQSAERCRRLRRACRFKDERGERGEGNCRRYRRVCQRWWN
jgi:hypothetical protein